MHDRYQCEEKANLIVKVTTVYMLVNPEPLAKWLTPDLDLERGSKHAVEDAGVHKVHAVLVHCRRRDGSNSDSRKKKKT